MSREERGLGDVNAAAGEFAAQFILIGDGGFHEEIANGEMAVTLQAVPVVQGEIDGGETKKT